MDSAVLGQGLVLPKAVVSVSDCLTDLYPVELDDGIAGVWHAGLDDATATVAEARLSADMVRVLAVNVPVEQTDIVLGAVQDKDRTRSSSVA